MSKTVFLTALFAAATLATGAMAECTPEQEAAAGKAAGAAAGNLVKQVVPVQGKQMVNLTDCDVRGGNFKIEFKYNFLGPDGLYWVEASGTIPTSGNGGDVKIKRMSPNLQAASAKSGVKLASN